MTVFLGFLSPFPESYGKKHLLLLPTIVYSVFEKTFIGSEKWKYDPLTKKSKTYTNPSTNIVCAVQFKISIQNAKGES